MMSTSRKRRRSAAARGMVWAAGFTILFSWQSWATIYTFPGCGVTLQSCISGSIAGDTVEIATNTPIAESPSLTHSLTLQSAFGFSGTLAANQHIDAVASGSSNYVFTINGLSLLSGFIHARQASTGTLQVNILSNGVQTTDGRTAILLDESNTGPTPGAIAFTIAGNQVTVPVATFGSTDGILVNPFTDASGSIFANSISMASNPDGAALLVDEETNTLTVDVIGNTISGADYDGGIQVSGGGTITARVIDNLVTGQNGNVGSAGAISVRSSNPGSILATVVGNTLSDNRLGLYMDGRVFGVVGDNVVVNSGENGMVMALTGGVVNNSYNVFGCNAFGNFGFAKGPGTLKLDPEFTAPGDYAPQPWSPLVDAGANALIPGDVLADLAGNARIVGPAVDIGALELQQSKQALSTLQNTCAAAKVKAAGIRVKRKAACYATAVQFAQPVSSSCLSAADNQFNAAFAAAEQTPPCLTNGDAGTMGTMLDGIVSQLVTDLTPGNATGVCPAKKVRAAGVKFLKRSKCRANGLSRGVATKTSCLAGAANALCGGFDRAQKKNDCVTHSNKGLMGTEVNGDVDSVLTALLIPE